jgi:5,5'-dehydrodivanillate O-demethylase
MFWQPIYRAEELPKRRAVPVRVMSEDLTLYRGEGGGVHLVEFRCLHRGAQLSIGKVEGEDLRCMYHGWKYDGEGRCVEQPAEVKSFCDRIRLRSYPACEYLGLIFAYLGEGEPPPKPVFQEFEEPGALLVPPTYVVPCNYFNQIDNNGDMHAPFLHSDMMETAGSPQDYGLTAEETEWGLSWNESHGAIRRLSHFIMPNLLQSRRVPMGKSGEWVNVLSWTLPIDDEHHQRLEVYHGRATDDEARRYQERFVSLHRIPELGNAILQGRLTLDGVEDRTRSRVQIQDYLVLVGQGVIPDRRREHFGRTDLVVLLCRKIWQRELRALADGRPLTAWSRPQKLFVYHESLKTAGSDANG